MSLACIAALLMAVFVLTVTEVGVRVVSRVDADGNVFFIGHRVRPYRLPITGVETAVRAFQSSPAPMVVEDPDLGWTSRPSSRNALFTFNDIGVRVSSAERTYPRQPPQGVLRVAVFGDSFALGDEVAEHESWPARLEQALKERGTRAEVMNFGVNGYGIDQAYLRWKKSGAEYAPQVVVLGLQLENVRRNVNLIRPLYNPFIDLPFSKPRFVLGEDGLRLVNVPAVGAARLADLLKALDEWPLVTHEGYYDAADFEEHPWQRSRLAAVVAGLTSDRPENREATAQYRLTMEIIAAFAADVRAAGGRFLLLHTPRREALAAFARGDGGADREFADALSRRFAMIDPVDELSQFAGRHDIGDLFRPGGHYSPRGNELLARAAVPAVVEE